MWQLRVRNLGKAYKRYHQKKGRLLEWLGAGPQHELRWALRDVSFDVAPGESVGIIGANGAGKSTLLKLISGVSQPTTGSIESAGTVSALLELGIGFHPDFTGRQNVYMAGSIRGQSPEQIAALMPEVEAFAEIGDYLDEPVRTYSSGMQVRLAFSVATVIRPDILIVDEALSVGDIYFQQKCFDRIRDFRDAGTTLFFVTHALPVLYSLCSRAMFIENALVQCDGTPKEAIDLYQARVLARNQPSAAALSIVDRDVEPTATVPPTPVEESAPQAPAASAHAAVLAPATGQVTPATGSYFTEGASIKSVVLRDRSGSEGEFFMSDGEMSVEITGVFERDVDDPHFGFQVRDRMGQALFMTTTHGLGINVGRVKKGEARLVRFRFKPLIAPGEYTITAGVANRGRFDGSFEEALVRHQDVAAFVVVDPADAIRWAGMINLQPTVEVDESAP